MYCLLNTNIISIILKTSITVKKITAKDKKTELTAIKSDSLNLYAVVI